MSGSTTLWITVGGVLLGSVAVAVIAALGEPMQRRWRARRRPAQATAPPGSPATSPPSPGLSPATSLATSPATSPAVDIAPGDWALGDPRLAAQLFSALCQLRHDFLARQLPPPEVDLALTGYERLVLRLARPAAAPPAAPWRPATGDQTGRCWVADATELPGWVPTPAPYPALTMVGSYGGWTVLTDRAAQPPTDTQPAAGAITPATPPASRRATVRALTSPAVTDQARDQLWPAPVRVGVLGPLDVQAPGTLDEQHRTVLASLVAVAALRPDGVPGPLLARMLPGQGAVAAAVRQLHDWLGADGSGLPRLREWRGAWHLSPDVRVDWHLFQELATADEPSNERARLVSALALIRGEPLGGTPLEPAVRQTLQRTTALRSLVTHSVRRTAALAGEAGDPATVQWALTQGLSLLPGAEELWRTLLLFQAEHDRGALEPTVAVMMSSLAGAGGRVKLERPTRALLNRLGVTTRPRAATLTHG